VILNVSTIYLFFILAFKIEPFAFCFSEENLSSVIFLHLMNNGEILLSCSDSGLNWFGNHPYT